MVNLPYLYDDFKVFLVLLITLTTVSYQAWKIARTNPVDALRYE